MNNFQPEVSIIMAGNRRDTWQKVYFSILNATKRQFEFVIVSPHPTLPKNLRKIKNIRHLEDFGSPSRAAQIAAHISQGKVIFTLMADDGIFQPNAIDVAIDELYAMGNSNKNLVVGKYFEGQDGTHKIDQPEAYYLLNYHDSTKTNIPDNFYGLNNGVLYRSYFEYLGGYNTLDYEVCPHMLADFAIRAQADGATFKFINYHLANYNWHPGNTGDHNFIFDAQTQHDEPRYKEIYQNGYTDLPMRISMSNWKSAPALWPRRWNQT